MRPWYIRALAAIADPSTTVTIICPHCGADVEANIRPGSGGRVTLAACPSGCLIDGADRLRLVADARQTRDEMEAW